VHSNVARGENKMEEQHMAGGSKKTAEAGTKSKLAPAKERSFAPDRKGESSGGALASKDKKRSVAASRDGGNTR
jgi:hypothetical protein